MHYPLGVAVRVSRKPPYERKYSQRNDKGSDTEDPEAQPRADGPP